MLCVRGTHARGFCFSDDLYQIASPDGGARLLFAEVDSGCGIFQLVAQLDRNGRHIRLCYDDNGLPHSIYDGSRLLQEYTYKGSYTYIYTDQDSYEPLAQVFHNNQDEGQYLAYFHTDQVGILREMTDIHGNLLWYGEHTAWGRLKKDERVYRNAHQPFRLQNQYFDEETGLHYNLMRYYEAETGRFINQDLIGLLGGENLYQFALNSLTWFDTLGLKVKILTYNHILKPDKVTDVKELKRQIRGQIRAFNKILKIEGLEGLQERIRNFRDDPTIEARERRYTSDKGSAGEGMVWLHEPDMCAGGAPESADRKGKSRENSIIEPNSSRISDEILKLKPSDEINKFRSKLILKITLR